MNAFQVQPAGTLFELITFVRLPHRKLDEIPVDSDCWDVILKLFIEMLSESIFCDEETDMEHCPITEYFPDESCTVLKLAEQYPLEVDDG